MSSIGNTAIKEIALGSTQIAEAYLGSALVFRKASPLVIPANTLLVRFGNANYDPAAAAQSNGNGHGTWTKVASAHNDWLWTYNNTNWQYWCGASDSARTAILTDSGDISILDHGDISAVTNISNMFDNIGYRIVKIAKFETGTRITTAYRFAAGIYRVTDYSFISTIGSRSTSVNLNQLVYLYTNWVCYKYNYGTVNEGNFPDPFAKTLSNGGKISSLQYIFAFRNFTGAFPMPPNNALSSGASGLKAFLGCTKGGALPSAWPANLTGNCREMFAACFNATGISGIITKAESTIGTAANKYRIFSCAGINNSAERTALRSAAVRIGGGDIQYLPNVQNLAQIGPSTGANALTGGSTSTGYWGATTLFPASLNRTGNKLGIDAMGPAELNTTNKTVSFARSAFLGFPGSSYSGSTAADYSDTALTIFGAFFQLNEHVSITDSDLASKVSWVLACPNISWSSSGANVSSWNANQASRTVYPSYIGSSSWSVYSQIRGQSNFDESRPVYVVWGATSNLSDATDYTKWFIGRGYKTVTTTYGTNLYVSWYNPNAENSASFHGPANFTISTSTFNT